MPTYHYRARNTKGKVEEGNIKSKNEIAVAKYLKQKGLVLVNIREKEDSTGDLSQSFGFKKAFVKSLKTKDISVFSRQLSTLINAGLPLVNALGALERSSSNQELKRVLQKVRADVEGGSSLSAALGKFNRYFDSLYCNMIRAGEQSGTLAEVMLNLTEALEKSETIKKKIKQAMSYPIVMVVGMILAVLVLGIFVIPKFAAVFNKFGADLPLSTKLVFGFSQFLTGYWYVVLASFVAAFFGFKKAVQIPAVRWKWDQWKLKFYIFGPLFLKIHMANFSYVVSILIKSGISVIETFELAEKTTDNVVIAKSIHDIRERVKQGISIAEAMGEEKFIPELVVQMISVGEESGAIEILLERVAEFYDEEAAHTISNLTTLIEPILLVFIAAIVLVMALAIFLPLWGLHSAIT